MTTQPQNVIRCDHNDACGRKRPLCCDGKGSNSNSCIHNMYN